MIATSPIGVVLCRLAAIFLAVEAVLTLGPVIGMSFLWSNLVGAIGYVAITVGIPLIVAALIWSKAERISQVETSKLTEETGTVQSTSELLVVGIMLIGVYTLVQGVAIGVLTEARAINEYILSESELHFMTERDSGGWAERLSYLLRIAIGVGLILGRNAIRRILESARYAGRNAT